MRNLKQAGHKDLQGSLKFILKDLAKVMCYIFQRFFERSFIPKDIGGPSKIL